MRANTVVAALAAVAFLIACREPTTEPAHRVGPVFSTGAAADCPTPANVTVTDEASLLAALSAASSGDVIGLDGFFPVAVDVTVSVENVTLTCATPGSGLRVASGATVGSLVSVLAPFVTVDRLTLDGSGTSGEPYFALNDPADIDGDGVTGFATNVRFT